MIANIRNPWVRRSLVVLLAPPVALITAICQVGLALLATAQDVKCDVGAAWKGSAKRAPWNGPR